MKLLNKQQVFDIVVNHLLTQNKRCATDRNECRYRKPDGTKCAIGSLIPDEKYNPEIEGSRVTNINGYYLDHLDFSDENMMRLLEQFQGVHDTTKSEFWAENLKILAKQFNLTYNGKQEASVVLGRKTQTDRRPALQAVKEYSECIK